MPIDTLVALLDNRRALPSFAASARLDSQGNGGLAFERIGANWRKKAKAPHSIEAPKKEWVDAIAGKHGDPANLMRYAQRVQQLIGACGGPKPLHFKTSWRLVTGTGTPNPLDNGLTWHRTLAVPYLPGSSVKGLVKAYVMEWANEDWTNEERDTVLRRIFGSIYSEKPTDADEDFVTGSVVFHDAVPIEPVEVVADVMTPHQPEYYKGNDGPSETVNPTPIMFAAVREATLQFAIAPARRYVNFTHGPAAIAATEGAQRDCNRVSEWLVAALALLGAGAKTKSGYGRMTPVII